MQGGHRGQLGMGLGLRKSGCKAGEGTTGQEEGERERSPQRRPGCKWTLEDTHISKIDL